MVFAPTPSPPDASPLVYAHPANAFTLTLPRQWAVYETNTTALAAAAFTPPNAHEPLLTAAVVNVGEALDSAAFGEAITRYQTQIRPDVEQYTEVERAAMGDGSWRISGWRRLAGGVTQQVNTFIARDGAMVGVVEAVVPDDPALFAQVQAAVNTFAIQPDALQPADLSALAAAKPTPLALLHVTTWTTADGVFFITGEVANYSPRAAERASVRAVLSDADGRALAEAVDSVMGHGIAPGGFAPFSLRFGQGRPVGSVTYALMLEGVTVTDAAPLGEGALTWTDESSIDEQGRLVVRGSVTNAGDATARQPRVTLTVFDAEQRVIAAAFADLAVSDLAAGQVAPYELRIAEMGGAAVNYIVNVQALRGDG